VVVVCHQRRAHEVEAEIDELVEAPDTRPVRRIGLIELARRERMLGLFHTTF
jgi:hypothetical protein